MKTKSLLLAGMILGALCAAGHAQNIDSIAPVVVKTVPEAGTKEIPNDHRCHR
jgi:Skp family chaperone for outer membrane proteins